MADTLLLADDNPTMQRVVRLTCADHGFEVVCVSDGQQAVDYLLTHRPALALISVTLQQLDGFEVARVVRDRRELSGLPVLLVAGAFDVIDEARVRESGAAGLLVKPFEPGLLIKRVKELLGMSQPEVTEPGSPVYAGRLVTVAEPPSSSAALPSEPATADATAVKPSRSGEHDPVRFDAPADSSELAAAGRTAATDTPVLDGDAEWFGKNRPGAYAASFEPERGQNRGDDDAAPGASAATPAVAADAFAMLWAHEQGEPPPPVPAPAPLELSEQTIDAVVERMTARLAERVTDSLATRLTDGLTPRVTDGLASRVTDDLAGRLTGSLSSELTDAVAARVSTGLAEGIAMRLAERVMQNAFGDSLRQTVHDVSERLVREEIARIRSAARDAPRS